ncbi:MAG: hypothetical protein FJ146_18335 [Deltaproteobacteria bacterium]|nr:hypothetical protein [Deltaproteobacteria bacterium]
MLSFTINSASISGAYRNAAIFSRATGENESSWHDLYASEFRPLGGLRPLGTRLFATKFNNQLMVHFSTVDSIKALAEAIERMKDDHSDLGTISRFLGEAMKAVSEIIAGDRSKGSVAMLALAIDAIKGLRSNDLINSSFITSNLVEAMRDKFGTSEAIDSSSNALFYDSHLILPGKLVDDAFTSAHSGQIMRVLDLPHASTDESAELF